MAILRNTTISGTGHLTLPVGTTDTRPATTTTIIRWTNTGTQAVSVLRGTTPTLTSTSWTCPTGVTAIDVLVVGGGGSGGNCQANGGTPGGGGGAGGVEYLTNFAVTPGTVYNVTVGAGGAAQTSANVIGNNGADSFFGSSANLVTNGTFTSNTTGWTVPSPSEGTFTSSGGRGILSNSNSSDPPVNAYQAITCVVGRTYLVVGSKWSGDTAVVNITENFTSGGGSGGPGNVLWWSGPLDQGRKVNTFVATQTTMFVTLRVNTNAFPAEAQFDDIGVYDYLTALNAIGGGGGGSDFTSGPFGSGSPARRTAYAGGSGGGGSNEFPQAATGFNNTPIPTTGLAIQGNNGGSGVLASGGGGAGQAGSPGNVTWGGGGAGLNFDISGTPTWYAGGGGAGGINGNNFPGMGGIGGGGQGGFFQAAATAGTASTGGGGGGGSASGGSAAASGAGGSGVVIIRYSVANDNTDPRGLTRYNRELRNVEFYNDYRAQWSQQNPAENFAFHNLLPFSQDFTQWTGNYFNNWINATVTTGQADPFGGTGANLLTGFYSRYTTSISVVAGQTYTFSVWLRNSALVNPVIIHILGGLNGVQQGVGNSVSITAASIANWTRFSVSYTIPASGINQVQCGVEFGSSKSASATGYSVFVFGGMLELSSTVGPYVATAGTPSPLPTRFGDYRIHTYTATGTSSFVPAVSGTVEVLVVGGGGAGGNNHAGGGGGGGVIYNTAYPVLSGVSYTVTVGGGGVASGGGTSNNTNGGRSQFGLLVAAGGGAGGNRNDSASTSPGQPGGSGGGGGGAQTSFPTNYQPGAPVIGQGNYGGVAVDILGGGGGGAGGVGQDGARGGRGGHGLLVDISGAPTYYGAGGGGGYSGGGTGVVNGGILGGGYGGYLTGDRGTAGTANTGGGGGGGGAGNTTGSDGGSGIVIVRYRYK